MSKEEPKGQDSQGDKEQATQQDTEQLPSQMHSHEKQKGTVNYFQ